MECSIKKWLKTHDTFSSVVRHTLTKWDIPKVTPIVPCSIKVTT